MTQIEKELSPYYVIRVVRDLEGVCKHTKSPRFSGAYTFVLRAKDEFANILFWAREDKTLGRAELRQHSEQNVNRTQGAEATPLVRVGIHLCCASHFYFLRCLLHQAIHWRTA